MKKLLTPVFTALISIIFLIGSAGISVVIRNCNCFGPSVVTEIFEPLDEAENSCCSCTHSQPSAPGTQSFESRCCTSEARTLTLNNYVSAEKITLNVNSVILPPVYISATYEVTSSFLKPLSYHNKHGGRDMVISYCQYLI